ncbi:MAG: MoeA/NarA subfamily Fe-S oxidoreductase [Herbinix sp.]|jgi:MoaA/NifB/PqqE/SkfB family radical SAM enzyme|nr:MoeA/NarA subfamily Fe-S oxidoreductase [Herbinix sp.]
MNDFNLEAYLSNGVENIVNTALRASLTNPKESLFMAKFAKASKKARKLRQEAEKHGEHIPPFLIASITSQCNLYCKGCYARANHSCYDKEPVNQLKDQEWTKIFREAKELGISFILLAGGEPLVRSELMVAAGELPEIVFPVFTNGTMLHEEYIKLFDKHRNLVPMVSVEGNEETTDNRRGSGVYRKVLDGMERMKQSKLLYGASITVTKNNIKEVTSDEFLAILAERGCKVVIYIEYVPISDQTKELAPEDEDREFLEQQLVVLRQSREDMLFISFPGDEKTSGGCLAAGRGFFHINPQGGAEPCPFSPYSDTNLQKVTLREALNSPLFRKLRDGKVLLAEHTGGCVLFEQEATVQALMNSSAI